jgi:hypothetical protein
MISGHSFRRFFFFIALIGSGFLSGCIVPLKTPPIQPGAADKPKIDFGELIEFAKAAGNAYEPDAAIEAAYGKKNVIIRNLPAADARYFILLNHNRRTQTIAVRGTANKQNAWVDIDSIKAFDSRLGIFIHSGFKAAADELYADAAPFLQKDYKTRITGHSLGGALACLLMLNLVHDGLPVDQVLTFGQPKVTNEQGGKTAAGVPYFRIINGHDIVAQAPPSNVVYDLSGTYEHFGPEITLNADHTWSYSPVHVPKDFVTNNNWKNIDLENGTDHQIKNYIERLSTLK